jgi:hypothetical protein
MRKGFDGLSGIVAHLLAEDPLSGHLFLFRNRTRDRLKILYWDRDGLAIWYKRLEKGTFQFPTDLVKDPSPSGKAQITPNQLALLLGGKDTSRLMPTAGMTGFTSIPVAPSKRWPVGRIADGTGTRPGRSILRARTG